MRLFLIVFLAVLGLLLLGTDALIEAGAVSGSGTGWMLPGGIALGLLAWLVSLLPG